MKVSNILLVVAVPFFLSACQQPTSANNTPSRTDADRAADEREVMELEREWSAMYGNRDAEGIMALMGSNPVIIAPGAAPLVGRDAVSDGLAADLANFDSSASWEPISATVSDDGSMAFDYGKVTVSMADGSTTESFYLVVWQKEGGEWKVAADMYQ